MIVTFRVTTCSLPHGPGERLRRPAEQPVYNWSGQSARGGEMVLDDAGGLGRRNPEVTEFRLQHAETLGVIGREPVRAVSQQNVLRRQVELPEFGHMEQLPVVAHSTYVHQFIRHVLLPRSATAVFAG